ncbi:MAG: hypothetical protein IRY91_05040 [Gemmatimonadaceae bacterium]|nr:hypothetical protein [Gemmatimonadaceae bacterium]
MRRASLALTLAAVMLLAACGTDDTPPGSATDTAAAVVVPDTLSPGFSRLDLLPAASVSDPSVPPPGSFWFRLDDGALEWYVRARQLTPARAYRVELATDGQERYAVASLRADASGAIAGHGVLTEFADQVCVGGEANAPRALAQVQVLRVAIKTDGSSPSASGTSPLTAPGNHLPCAGNGDNRWDYVLFGRHDVALAGDSAAR